MNKTRVTNKSRYYFEDFYFSDNGMIVGIKDLAGENPNDPGFMIMFDINGILPPNTWGKDIYGVNIYGKRACPFWRKPYQ